MVPCKWQPSCSALSFRITLTCVLLCGSGAVWAHKSASWWCQLWCGCPCSPQLQPTHTYHASCNGISQHSNMQRVDLFPPPVIIHPLSLLRPACSLDTGRLNPETYQLFDAVEKHYGIRIEYTFPDAQETMELVRTKGMFSFYEDGHQECCRVRKVRGRSGEVERGEREGREGQR